MDRWLVEILSIQFLPVEYFWLQRSVVQFYRFEQRALENIAAYDFSNPCADDRPSNKTL